MDRRSRAARDLPQHTGITGACRIEGRSADRKVAVLEITARFLSTDVK